MMILGVECPMCRTLGQMYFVAFALMIESYYEFKCLTAYSRLVKRRYVRMGLLCTKTIQDSFLYWQIQRHGNAIVSYVIQNAFDKVADSVPHTLATLMSIAKF